MKSNELARRMDEADKRELLIDIRGFMDEYRETADAMMEKACNLLPEPGGGGSDPLVEVIDYLDMLKFRVKDISLRMARLGMGRA